MRRQLYTRPRFSNAQPLPAPLWQRWTRKVLLTVGGITLAFLVIGFAVQLGGRMASQLPNKFVLSAQFTGALNETPGGLGFFASPAQDFYSVLTALRAGAKDPKAKALVAQIWNGAYSLGQIKEIHAVLDEWRAAGKPTYAYADSLGDGATGMDTYWLASAFDKIWVQDLGFVTMNGFRAELPFGRAALDKLGIKPEFFPFTTYKSAMDMFLRDAISPADRAQLSRMLNSLNNDFIADVTQVRKIKDKELRAALNTGSVMANEALEANLIDRVGYQDELSMYIHLSLKDEQVPYVALAHYIPHAMEKEGKLFGKTRVAMINLEGPITDLMTMPEDASGAGGFLGNSPQICISCAISSATDDPKIRAILLRVNSPGGSPIASETIRRAMLVARGRGKPVIVSMGDVAASGGYWVATGADKIIAYPTTITGSIGVVGGKFSFGGLLDKYGVRFDQVSSADVGPDIASLVKPYDAKAAAKTKAELQTIYDAFKQRVAESRPNIKDVEAIAQGRVWLGRDAHRIGLVDTLGGLDDAKAALVKALGLKSEKEMVLVSYMPARSPLEGLKALLGLPGVMAKVQTYWRDFSASAKGGAMVKADFYTIK